jgi:capsular exopolysaccharide synthesis family protein
VITSGPLPPNSSEMFGSRRMAELVKRLEELADVVIFDSPPVLAVTDAIVLSQRVGGVVLVVEAGRTRREAVAQAMSRLRQVGAHLLGGVLNRASGQGLDSHYRTYYTRSSERGLSGQVLEGKPRRWWQRLPVLKS